ncbi:MAG: helix-hairpin-helix domain-containing protein [Tatlockia sp.]|nr:helix-hairpin-helix domain-containing protein [Tatlockia sp.]
MKAKIFAAVLSLYVVSLPVQSSNQLRPPAAKTVQIAAKIDLNKADAKALSKSVKGIGQKRAEAIIKYRDKHGKFNSIEDLAKVRGFSTRFVESHLKELKEAFTVN